MVKAIDPTCFLTTIGLASNHDLFQCFLEEEESVGIRPYARYLLEKKGQSNIE